VLFKYRIRAEYKTVTSGKKIAYGRKKTIST